MASFRFFIPDSKPQLKAISKAKVQKRINHWSKPDQDYLWEGRSFLLSQLVDLDLIDDFAGQSLLENYLVLHLDTNFHAFRANPFYDYWNPLDDAETGPDVLQYTLDCMNDVDVFGPDEG